jgi:hypothetical protein
MDDLCADIISHPTNYDEGEIELGEMLAPLMPLR